MSSFVLAVSFSALLLASSVEASLRSRWLPPKPVSVEQIDPKFHNRDCINFKFVEGSRVRLREGNLVSLAGHDLTGFDAVISQTKIKSLARLIDDNEQALDALREHGQQRSGKKLADLNNWYRIILDSSEAPEQFIESLLGLDIIEDAHANPIPQPCEDIEPETDDFTDRQGYLGDAPVGIGANAAWELEGGLGEDVKIICIEWNWTWTHEDLKAPFHFQRPRDANFYAEHGNAVVGIMIGQHNGYGIDGVCPESEIGGWSLEPDNAYPNLTNAINGACNRIDEGDIFLLVLHIEFQGRLSPMEVMQENFDVIETVTANGFICCAAAGNGSANLDDQIYQGRFDPDNRHSGAIIVGGGNPPQVGTPRSRCDFSNYGQRVDLQGWGYWVMTTGYGWHFNPNNDIRQRYTAQFSGTSSATPMVAGSAACLQGIFKARMAGEEVLTGQQIRDILVESGTAQQGNDHIGPLPNLAQAVELIPSRTCVLYGQVLDAEDDSPLPGARVGTDYGLFAETDEDGRYRIEDASTEMEFALTASFMGYNDSTLNGLIAEEDEELETNFHLLHPEAALDIERIEAMLNEGEQQSFSLELRNSGNGALNWTSEFELDSLSGLMPFDNRLSLQAGQSLEDDRLMGVAFSGERFYVSGANGADPNMIYVLNRVGELEDQFMQPGDTRNGVTDIEWDGEALWLAGGDTIYAISLGGEVIAEWPARINATQAIAWDASTNLLWVSGVTTNYDAYDREGNYIRTINRHGWRTYGLASWPGDPDGMSLYVSHSSAETANILSKMDPVSEDTALVRVMPLEAGPQGAVIVDDWDIYSINLVTVTNVTENEGGDRIELWLLAANTEWLEIEPQSGELPAGEALELTLTLAALGLHEGALYQASLMLRHNAAGERLRLPIELTVVSPNEPPSGFALAYPTDGDTVSIGEVGFGWQRSHDSDEGERVSYRLWISNQTDSLEIEAGDTTFSLNLDTLGLQIEEGDGAEWRVEAISGGDTVMCESRFSLNFRGLGVSRGELFPKTLTLYPASPNPFNSRVTLHYSVPQAGRASLTIFDVSGREVYSHAADHSERGMNRMNWNALNQPAGIYFVRLEGGGEARMMRAVLLK